MPPEHTPPSSTDAVTVLGLGYVGNVVAASLAANGRSVIVGDARAVLRVELGTGRADPRCDRAGLDGSSRRR